MPTVLKSRGECQAVLGGQAGGGTWVSGDDRQRWRCRGSLHQDFQPSGFFFLEREQCAAKTKHARISLSLLCGARWKLRVDISATAEHHMKT